MPPFPEQRKPCTSTLHPHCTHHNLDRPLHALLPMGLVRASLQDSRGCTEMCSEGSPFIRGYQLWQGAQTLVRQITYDPAARSLVAAPVTENDLLRVQGQGPLYAGGLRLSTYHRSSSNSGSMNASTGSGGASAGGQQAMQQPAAAQLVAGPQGGTAESAALTDAEVSGAGSAPGAGGGNSGVPAGAAFGNWSGQVTAPLLPYEATALLGAGANSSNSSTGSTIVKQHSPSGRRQLDVQLLFDLQASSAYLNGSISSGELQPFEVGLSLLTGGKGTATRVLLNGTAMVTSPSATSTSSEAGQPSPAGAQPPQPGNVIVLRLGLYVDRSHSGGMSSPTVQGGHVLVPVGGMPGSGLSLRVFVDRSIVEVYAMGGRATVTSRIYPLPPPEAITKEGQVVDAWGMEVFGAWSAGDVQVQATVHELGSCRVDADNIVQP